MKLLEKSDTEIRDIAQPIWDNLVKSSNLVVGFLIKSLNSSLPFISLLIATTCSSTFGNELSSVASSNKACA